MMLPLQLGHLAGLKYESLNNRFLLKCIPFRELVLLGKSFVVKSFQIFSWLNFHCWSISSIGLAFECIVR